MLIKIIYFVYFRLMTHAQYIFLEKKCARSEDVVNVNVFRKLLYCMFAERKIDFFYQNILQHTVCT